MPTRRPSHGFTLIELLVVIAIIALLVSLLIPSLNKAKDLAKSVQCMSNQRMLMYGMIMYAEEHENLIPPTAALAERAGNRRFWSWKLTNEGYIPGALPNTQVSYLTSDAYYCPSHPPANAADAGRIGDWWRTYGLRQWIAPGLPIAIENVNDYKNIDRLPRPADVFLLGDSVHAVSLLQYYSIGQGSNGERQRVHLRHSGLANLAFADGHVDGQDAAYVETLIDTQPELSLFGYLAWPEE